MEQKEVVHKFFIIGRMTVDKLFQMLGNLSNDLFLQIIQSDKKMVGEVPLYRLLNQKEQVTSKFLHLSNEVDIQKLKEYFQEQGLPFAYRKEKEGIHVFFRIKEEELAKNALKNIYKDAVNNAQEFAKKILKKPGQMSFEERVRYAKQTHYKGNIISNHQVKSSGRKFS